MFVTNHGKYNWFVKSWVVDGVVYIFKFDSFVNIIRVISFDIFQTWAHLNRNIFLGCVWLRYAARDGIHI